MAGKSVNGYTPLWVVLRRGYECYYECLEGAMGEVPEQYAKEVK
jgi:hypothetical protein